MTEEVRLGVILPSVNTVVENWYPKIVPDGVSVHFARMLIADGSSPEEIIGMDREDGVRAIHQIAGCRAHAIALRLHSIEHYPRPRVRRTPAYRDPAYRGGVGDDCNRQHLCGLPARSA